MKINEQQPLLRPIQLGDLALPNRVAMASLTRMRAANPDLAPTQVHADYYAQRASAGLIVSEGVFISPEAVGWADVPGLWSEAQARGWQRVTDAVHLAGGRIFAQLWHPGALGHPDFHDGKPPLSPSAVNPEQQSVTATGHKDTVVPIPMTKEDIRRTVGDFGKAARLAMSVGFDGVQIQGGYHYLFNQFLHVRTNRRTDEYGGSVENRARFLFEVLEAVVETVDPKRVGIKTGPATSETGAFVSTDETLATSDYVISRLNDYELSHLLLMGGMADLTGTPLSGLSGDGMFRHFRSLYRGNLIANVDIDQERGNKLIDEGLVDMVAFGRPFIANPDLPFRFAANAAIAEIDWGTVYGKTAAGYTDYPALQAEAA